MLTKVKVFSVCEDSRKLTLLRVFYYQSHLLQNYPFSRLPIPFFSSQTPFFHLNPQFFSSQSSVFLIIIIIFLLSHSSFHILHFSFLISHLSFLILSAFSFYLRPYFPITTVLNQSLRTPAYWSWESESRITT